MKYFIKSPLGPSNTYEIKRDVALQIYKIAVGVGMENLMAIPKFNVGKSVTSKNPFIIVWGENISSKECFRRRLNGDLHAKILKNIKDTTKWNIG